MSEQTVLPAQGGEDTEDLRAAIDEGLAEIDRIRQRMIEDDLAIERSSARTRAILAQLRSGSS